jgi:hypothetical protein
MDISTLLHSPHFLLAFTVSCFVIALVASESLPYAKSKGRLIAFWIAAIVSIIFGLAGWVGFFIELLAYVHKGFNG